jgi:hypothetical protein
MTKTAAMKRLNCSAHRLDVLVTQNKLEAPEKDADGRWWYSIEGIEELVVDATEEETSQQQIVMASSKVIEAQGAIMAKLVEQQMGHNDELAKTMVKMIEETGKREAALMGAFLGATQRILEVQTEWSSKAMERTTTVEAELDQAHDTIQQAMNLNSSREVQMAEAASRQRRNDAIGRGLEAHIPTVLSMVAQKFGVPAEIATDPLVKELMSTVTEEQALKLYQSGILTQTQMGQLVAVWEASRKEKIKTEAPPVEPKVEAPKVEAPKVEAPKAS